MYCRNNFLQAQRFTKFSSMCVLFAPKDAAKSYALVLGCERTTGFSISDQRFAFPLQNAGLRFMRPGRQQHSFQFNVHVIQYNTGLTQNTEKRRWINKVIITVLSQVMSRIWQNCLLVNFICFNCK